MYKIRHILILFSLLILLENKSVALAQNQSTSTIAKDSLLKRDLILDTARVSRKAPLADTTRSLGRDLILDTTRVSRRSSLSDSTLFRDPNAEADSAAIAAIAAQTDSIARADSIAKRIPALVDIPAFSTARDSIIEDFSNGRRLIFYYGDVKVTYGSMKMSADYMLYNMDTKTVYASGVPDTLGNIIGKPVMEDGEKTYTMENVYYNFNSGKAKIKNMVTQEEEGFLHGENLKMMPDKSINITQGKYTVCELDHPHYYLNLTAAKVMTEPKQKTVFGPANLVLADVPLPLFLPFGFVPKQPTRASGILFPTYGEETSRGFYLRDLGYYMVFGDHFDLALTGDIYTLGSWSIEANSRYKYNYKFSGNFSLTYSNDQTGEKGSNDFSQSRNFRVSWSHSQDPKARPGTSFRASVNFSSPSNNKYNSQTVQQALENQISSSISYSKTWSKMSLSLNVLHSQNSRDSSYSITLPNITFNVNRFNPFKRKQRVGKERFYEKITFSYNTTFQNRIGFKASQVNDPDFWSKLKTGMTHKFSIGLPPFTILKYFNFSPSVNYGMNWYFQEQNRIYNPETNKVETIVGDQFSAFGISQDYSAALSMSTRIYGMFQFKGKKSKIKAIRHMITPSISASFRPELGTAMNGYVTYNYVDTAGIERSVDYNKYAGGVYSPPGKGKNASLSFSLGNNLEAKMVDKRDTTGTGEKKIKLIDNLNINGSYNFLADSMKLSTFNVSANTTIFQKMGLNFNFSLDPYAIDEKGKRYNQFNIMKGGSIVRVTNAGFSTSYSWTGDGKGKGDDGSSGSSITSTDPNAIYNRIFYHPVTGEYIPGGWLYYMNPSIPWSFGFNYSLSFSRSYQYANEQLQVKNNITQTLGLNGSIKLTKDLNFTMQTGVDLTKMRLTTTQISATYDLHCFQISVQWIPIGQWESWSFRINAKASALADLLQYKKSSSYWDN